MIVVKSNPTNPNGSVECQKLAEKHGVSVEHIRNQLDIGKKEEMEHTDRQFEARKIALDHLEENPEYYTKLKDAGLVEKACDKKVSKSIIVRLQKAKYISKKMVNGKWVYKYTEEKGKPSKKEEVTKEKIPANQFDANSYYEKNNNPETTIESVLKNASPEIKAKIKETEAKIKGVTPTIDKYRISGEGAAAVYDKARAKKHEEIILKMLSPEKIRNASPGAGKQPTFMMLGGRGGSGKSWFDGNIYDPKKAIIMDSDEIKKQLAEYDGWNAFEVHEESSDILEKAMAMAKAYKLNIVIDATMKTTKSAVDKVVNFKNAGYDIKAHYMYCPRRTSAQRAVKRFAGPTGRYVPVGVVLSNTSNEKTFDAIKQYASSWSFRDSSGDPPPDLISQKNGAVMAKAIKESSNEKKDPSPYDMYDFGPVVNEKDYPPDLKKLIEDNKPGKKSIIVKTMKKGLMSKQKTITTPSAEYDRKYKLQGRKKFYGLDIAIENKKGSYRKGKDPNGKPWKTYMNFDYGRIGGTKAVDNEGVDIYLGPDDTSDMVYVVHQQDPFTRKYDEDKAMCQFPSRESAIEGYLSQYDRPDFLGPVSEFTIDEFKDALKEKRGTMLYRSDTAFRKE